MEKSQNSMQMETLRVRAAISMTLQTINGNGLARRNKLQDWFILKMELKTVILKFGAGIRSYYLDHTYQISVTVRGNGIAQKNN